MTSRHIPAARKRKVIAMQSGLCACGCGRRVGNGEAVEYDHIVPVALGGGNNLANIQGLAPCCHRRKTTGTTIAEKLRSDLFGITKANRIARKMAGKVRKGPKIQSRGFQKKPEGYQHRWGK